MRIQEFEKGVKVSASHYSAGGAMSVPRPLVDHYRQNQDLQYVVDNWRMPEKELTKSEREVLKKSPEYHDFVKTVFDKLTAETDAKVGTKDKQANTWRALRDKGDKILAKFRVDRPKMPIVYTIGKMDIYNPRLQKNDLKKLGRDPEKNYEGGLVFQTYGEAYDWLRQSGRKGYAIYTVAADWNADTAPNPKESPARFLIKTSKILGLAESRKTGHKEQLVELDPKPEKEKKHSPGGMSIPVRLIDLYRETGDLNSVIEQWGFGLRNLSTGAMQAIKQDPQYREFVKKVYDKAVIDVAPIKPTGWLTKKEDSWQSLYRMGNMIIKNFKSRA